jgi:hypothetical protein
VKQTGGLTFLAQQDFPQALIRLSLQNTTEVRKA